MPALSSSNNSVEVHVKTTADNSGIKQTDEAIRKVSGTAAEAAISTSRLTSAVALGNAAYSAFSASLGKVTDFLGSSIDSANRYQSAVTGLSSVSRSFTGETDQAKAAAQSLSKDGLMTVSDSATGLKNLLASGFSLPQAIQLMNAFKNSAAFNRQETLGFGEAVRTATEGVKNGNSILVDNAGVTKNLSTILVEAGYAQNDVMNATTDAGVRQALYNGILHETVAQTGNAAQYAQMYAGQQAAAGAATEKAKQTVGALEQAISGGLISSYTSFLGANQQTVISLGAGTIAAAVFAGGLFGVVKAIQAFSLESVIAAASNPLILALSAIGVLAGVVVYKAVDNMQKKLASSTDSSNKLADSLGKTVPGQSAKATKAMEDLQKKLGDIDQQIAKNNRDFQESLAEMIRSNQDKVTDLTKQLDTENTAYSKSQDQKTLDFTKSTQDELTAHQKRAAAIQRDIDNELALGKFANQASLRDLQDKLKQENDDYTASSADKKAGYDQDVADAKASHDSKLTDLQTQLDQENTLLTKHAADVAAVRNTTLLDEIDKLKRSHDEQLVAFAQQKADAISSAKSTADGVGNVWSNANTSLNSQMAGLGTGMGTAMGNAFKDAIKNSVVDVGKGIVNFFGKATSFIAKGFDPRKPAESLSQLWQEASSDPAFKLRAGGGPVTSGQPYLVGDNPDGSINSTTEMFIPSQSGTIVPAKQTRNALAGQSQGGVNFTQINHNYNDIDLQKANQEMGYRLSLYA